MAGSKTSSPARGGKSAGGSGARPATSVAALAAATAAPLEMVRTPAPEPEVMVAAEKPVITETPLAATVPEAANMVTDAVAKVSESAADAAETMTDKAGAVAADAIEDGAHAAAETIDTLEETATAAKAMVPPSPFFDLMKGLTMATVFDTTRTNAVFGDMNEKAKGAMEKGAKFAEDFQDFAKGNVEAMVASGRVAAKGVEEMAQYSADYGRKTVEQATTAMKSLAGVKSPTELFQLQSEYAKSAVDSMVAETSKFTESYLKLLGDIAQPLTSRYAVAAEKIKAVAA